ncbi:hypothetical protein Tco_0363236 [Tanacetum coccineum]
MWNRTRSAQSAAQHGEGGKRLQVEDRDAETQLMSDAFVEVAVKNTLRLYRGWWRRRRVVEEEEWWLRAEGSKLRVEGSGVDLMKRSGGRTLLTQKLLGILLLSKAEED